MISLPTVTLIAYATINVEATVRALEYSCKGISFGAVRLVSPYRPVDSSIEWFECAPCDSVDEWSRRMVYELTNFVDTEHCLLIHADGFVVNPDKWNPNWLNFDYIGAPWPLPTDDFSYRDINGTIQRVGNSVSLRSKKLLNTANDLSIPWQSFHGYWNEDGFICVNNRHLYEQNGCKFVPFEEAIHFGRECPLPENMNIDPFIFHRYEGSNSNYPRF